MVIAVIVVISSGAVFIWTGVYNITAAEPHATLVRWLLATGRDPCIATRAPSLDVPVLSNPQRIEAGCAPTTRCAGHVIRPRGAVRIEEPVDREIKETEVLNSSHEPGGVTKSLRSAGQARWVS